MVDLLRGFHMNWTEAKPASPSVSRCILGGHLHQYFTLYTERLCELFEQLYKQHIELQRAQMYFGHCTFWLTWAFIKNSHNFRTTKKSITVIGCRNTIMNTYKFKHE